MSLPEISPRCLACGAAARAGASFCQQCGQRLAAGGEGAPGAGGAAPAPEQEGGQGSPNIETRAAEPPPTTRVAPVTRPAAEGPDGTRGLRPTRETAVRAAARVRETVVPRVERMRDEALVALEETPDDSGLRFVVIAVALFALFLLFLLLSTTVLR